MQIFKLLTIKDYFEALYLKGMSKRLLGEVAPNIAIEKSIVNKFKDECGGQFLSNADTMI